jgi:hypothetical protein
MRLLRERLNVRRMMVAVAVVAVNLGLIRGALDLTAQNTSLFVVLPAFALGPSLSLLTVAAARVGLGLAKHGQAPPFSTGYLLSGSLASFAVCMALATQMFMLFAVTIRDPIEESALVTDKLAVGDVLTITILAMPQIGIALIGGKLAARHGLMIVLVGRVRPLEAPGSRGAANEPGFGPE